MGGSPVLTDELFARAVLEQQLGCTVEEFDDGSRNSMVDLLLVCDGIAFAAAEVVSARDGRLLAQLDGLRQHAGRAWRLDVSGLRSSWNCELLPGARVDKVVLRLPRLIRELDKLVQRVAPDPTVAAELADSEAELEEQLERLGVQYCSHRPAGANGAVVTIHPPASGGWVPDHNDDLAVWAGDFLRHESRQDVIRKLEQSGHEQRHAFVLVPLVGFDGPFEVHNAFMEDVALPLPGSDPSLPQEITHLWVVGAFGSGVGFCWSAATGWAGFCTVGR